MRTKAFHGLNQRRVMSFSTDAIVNPKLPAKKFICDTQPCCELRNESCREELRAILHKDSCRPSLPSWEQESKSESRSKPLFTPINLNEPIFLIVVIFGLVYLWK